MNQIKVSLFHNHLLNDVIPLKQHKKQKGINDTLLLELMEKLFFKWIIKDQHQENIVIESSAELQYLL